MFCIGEIIECFFALEGYYEVIVFEGNNLLILKEFRNDTSFLLCAIEIR
jgi:hypothetical protein